MAGKTIVSSMNLPAKNVRNMKALRVTVLIMFVVSVGVTVWSMLRMHEHILHYTHVVLITLTFLLIALYLHKSAEIASLIKHRELLFRLTVDSSVGFIEYVSRGSPIYNACAGALAKIGIYVKFPAAMETLALTKSVALTGNSKTREGYAVTERSLEQMGMKFSDSTESCPVKLMLGQFSVELCSEFDFILTNDKIAYVLPTIFICRLYVKFSRLFRVLFGSAALAVVILCIFKQFTFAGAAIAVLAAAELMIIYRIDKRTKRMSFKSVTASHSTRRLVKW